MIDCTQTQACMYHITRYMAKPLKVKCEVITFLPYKVYSLSSIPYFWIRVSSFRTLKWLNAITKEKHTTRYRKKKWKKKAKVTILLFFYYLTLLFDPLQHNTVCLWCVICVMRDLSHILLERNLKLCNFVTSCYD